MPETTRRILYADPQTEGTDATFMAASGLGFTHVLLPPPWPASPRGDRFAPAALDAPELVNWAKAAEAGGLTLLIDVQVNRLAFGAGAGLGEGLFHATDPRAVLDPRHAVDLDADTAFPHGKAEAAALGSFWARHAKRWAAQGVRGLRLLGLDAIAPDSLGAFMHALAQGGTGNRAFRVGAWPEP